MYITRILACDFSCMSVRCLRLIPRVYHSGPSSPSHDKWQPCVHARVCTARILGHSQTNPVQHARWMDALSREYLHRNPDIHQHASCAPQALRKHAYTHAYVVMNTQPQRYVQLPSLASESALLNTEGLVEVEEKQVGACLTACTRITMSHQACMHTMLPNRMTHILT